MNKQKTLVALEDIIVVSVPTTMGDFAEFITGKSQTPPSTFVVPKGEVWELAIISPDKTQFVLLREFDKGVVRDCNHFIDKNSCGEFEFRGIDHKESHKLRFIKTEEEEKRSSVIFQDLESRNRVFISNQLELFQEKVNKQIAEEQASLKLKKDRAKYLSIFKPQPLDNQK